MRRAPQSLVCANEAALGEEIAGGVHQHPTNRSGRRHFHGLRDSRFGRARQHCPSRRALQPPRRKRGQRVGVGVEPARAEFGKSAARY